MDLSSHKKTLGKYKILRSLGTGGSCKVKSAWDPDLKQKVAIKILNEKLGNQVTKLVMDEVDTMKNFTHKNILKLLDYGKEKYDRGNGKGKEVSYISLEIAEKGCIFDYVSQTGFFEEKFARYYFHQLIQGLEYAHSTGYCHRDIKPENILIDKDYQLKIADFGFSAPILGRNGKGFLFTKLGTRPYMAPEIHLDQPYTGEGVDLFASAIVLFILVSGTPPFSAAIPKDAYYKTLARGQFDVFWDAHCKSKPGGKTFFSTEFKDFIQIMFNLDPNKRLQMVDLLNHSWMTGEVATDSEVQKEFDRRFNLIQGESEHTESSEEYKKGDKKAFRSGPNEEIEQWEASKNLQDFDPISDVSTRFFSNNSPDDIEKLINDYVCDSLEEECVVNSEKYKIQFTLGQKDGTFDVNTDPSNHDDPGVSYCVKIYKVADDKVSVEFSKVSGDVMKFNEGFNDFKNKYLKDIVTN